MSKLETQAYALHFKLSKYLHCSQWDAFQEKTTNVIDHKFYTKKEIQKKKLKHYYEKKLEKGDLYK